MTIPIEPGMLVRSPSGYGIALWVDPPPNRAVEVELRGGTRAWFPSHGVVRVVFRQSLVEVEA